MCTLGDALWIFVPGELYQTFQVTLRQRFPQRPIMVATVSGEWAGDLKATNKAAGGSDAIVRVKLTQERVSAQPAAVTMVTGTLAVSGQALRADLPLPPAPAGFAGAKREYQLELRTTREGKSQTLVQAPPDGKGTIALPWTTTQQGTNWTYSAKQEGETVVVTAAPPGR